MRFVEASCRCLRSWLRSIEHLLFASPCVICGEGDCPICEPCREELVDTSQAVCPRCALKVGPWANIKPGCSWCSNRTLGFDEAIALGPYEDAIRTMCLQLKTVHNEWLARWVVDLLIDGREDRLRAASPTLVIPVPLHWRRRLVRGYNQSDALAGHLARRLGISRMHALRRVVATPKLIDKGRADRKRLMRGVFRVRRGISLEGQTILLVDDILTSGATCGSAAKALKKAGAARVIAVVIGRAEGRT